MTQGTTVAEVLRMYPEATERTFGFSTPVPGNTRAQYMVVLDATSTSVRDFSISFTDQRCVN